MLISQDYRSLNKELHETNSAYGTSGHKYAGEVMELCSLLDTQDVLDYGCGKCTLGQAMPFSIKEYDPCIDGKDTPPDNADIVVCTDVLEHIEPDCLDAVLSDIARLANHAIFLTIATFPAQKTLSDGRNAHLIQEGLAWWINKLDPIMDIMTVINGKTIAVSASPKGRGHA